MARNVELRRTGGNSYDEKLNVKTSWDIIENKPTNFTPDLHSHNIEEVNTLEDELDNRYTKTETDTKISEEIGKIDIPTHLSELSQNASYRTVTDDEKATWNAKETTTGAQAKANTALASAKTYTDSEVSTVITELDSFKTLKGVPNGLAELNENGHVPATQLPSYVDDLEEYADRASFPTTGESDKIYIDKNTNKIYRWSRTDYVEISKSLALGETASTAYAGSKGKANRDYILDILNINTSTGIVGRAQADQHGGLIHEKYATKSWVNDKGFLESISSLIIQLGDNPETDIVTYNGTGDTILLELHNEFLKRKVIDTQYIPDLDASKITKGELHRDAIPILPISKIEDLDTTLSAMATAVAGKAETNHTHSQYLTDAPTTGSEYVRKSGEWVKSRAISDDDILHWNLAYGWGDHADEGYLKSAPNDYVVFGKYTTPPSGKRWVGTSAVSNPYYDVRSESGNLSSSELPSPSGLPAGRTGRVYTATLPIQEAYYIVQEIEVDHGLITLTRTNGGTVEFTIPKPDGGGSSDNFYPSNLYVPKGSSGGLGILRMSMIGTDDLTVDMSHNHDSYYYKEAEVDDLLSTKVDKVSGKGLSTNDFTTTLKSKLDGIETGANKYTHPTYTSRISALRRITVDSTGHVSAVADVTATDIPRLPINKIIDLQTELDKIPTDLDDLVVAGADQVPVRASEGWVAASQVPDSTRWDTYRLRVGSFSSGKSGAITFGI